MPHEYSLGMAHVCIDEEDPIRPYGSQTTVLFLRKKFNGRHTWGWSRHSSVTGVIAFSLDRLDSNLPRSH